MTISFAAAQGNFVNRMGATGGILKQIRTSQNSMTTVMIDTTTGVVAELNAESDIQAIMGGSYLSVLAGMEGGGSVAQQLAQAIVNRTVYRDRPQLNQTLQSTNTIDAILEIIRQMRTQGASVLAMTVTATAGNFIGTGDASVVTSVKRASDGTVCENSFAEIMTLTVTSDSYLGNAIAGQEVITLTGTGSVGVFAFNWPQGSNCQTSFNVIDGGSNASGGNILNNSGFEDFTNNTPDNWEITAGSAGTNFFEETTLVFDPTDGGKALRITGTTGTLCEIRQQFNVSEDGTTLNLEPLTQYAFNIWMRRDGVAAAAGTMIMELVDENGTVVKDANQVDNNLSIDLTALSTSYAPQRVAFRTPAIMPDELYLRFRMSVALTNGRSVYLDKGGLGLMTQAYVGGPSVAVFAGSIALLQASYAEVTVTNSRGSGNTIDTWQTMWFRLLPEVQANDLMLPSNAAPTISDGLIG